MSNDYEGINFQNPGPDDLQKADELDALWEVWDRERRLGMNDPKPEKKPASKSQSKAEPEPEPQVSAAELKFQVEEHGYKLAQIVDRWGPQSEHAKRAKEENAALHVALAKAQSAETSAMVRQAAEADVRARARRDAEKAISDERARAAEIAEGITVLEGEFAAKAWLSNQEKTRFSEEAVEAKANEAFDLRWRVLQAESSALEATASLLPSEQELAKGQARAQVLTGSAAHIPTLSESDRQAVRHALGGHDYSAYVAEQLDKKFGGDSWRRTPLAKKLKAARRGDD